LAAQAEVVYKDREAIIGELASALQAKFPDANITPDTVWYALLFVWATGQEGVYLAAQLLHNDMFIQTASGVALMRHGEMYGRPLKGGTPATGTVLVSGAGGIPVPANTELAAPQASDDALSFLVSVGGTIPAPGIPTAPTLVDAGSGGGLAAGTYEYAVTFVTIEGETTLGTVSSPITVAVNHNVTVSNIPIGGPGTIARKLYRRVNGGVWGLLASLVTTLNNNTTTSVLDAAGSWTSAPPTVSTAERLTVAAESEDTGSRYNVVPNTITEFVTTTPGLTSVTNVAAFVGGSDDEDIEAFRAALAEWVRSPKSGSPADIKAWAEAIPGVETATVIENDNMGVSTTGHVTVRISGPGGSVPGIDVINAVIADLTARNLATVVIHVGTFTPDVTNATVTLTLTTGYDLADVTPSVTQAIQDYINSLPVAGTIYKEGIAAAVFNLPGIETLVVNTPASDVTVSDNHKAVPGVIAVN
jgi:uncharacterized phage protein gp47/JayE